MLMPTTEWVAIVKKQMFVINYRKTMNLKEKILMPDG